MRFSTFVVFAGAIVGYACSDENNPPPAGFSSDSGATGSGGSASTSDSGSGGSGGEQTTDAGGAAGESATSSDVTTSGGGSGGDGGGGDGSGGDGAGGSGGSNGGNGGNGGNAGSTMLPEIDACPSDDLDEPPDFDAVCDLDPTWGEGQPLVLGGVDGEQLVSITPDELTVVWFSPGRSEGQFLVADRTTTDDEFGAPVTVPARRVLSAGPDGLRLVTSEQGTSLATVSRSNRGDEFSEPVEGEFELLNAYAAEDGLLFRNAIISPDDQTLYYAVSGLADDYPVLVSERSGDDPWPVGEPLSSCEFKAYGALVRVPTAISSDGLTLFFQDPAVGGARAAFRETTDSDFTWFVDLGAVGGAQPNGACDRLYYFDEESSSVLVSERE